MPDAARAHVRLGLPDGSERTLGPGDWIGRTWTAALHLDDARVSEAHAMVSLRGRSLKLLGLRGRFAVRGKPVTEVELRAGLEVALARGLVLTVLEVVVPDRVLALESPELGRRVLSGVASILTKPVPALRPGYHAAAAAHVWSTGAGWRLQVPGEAARVLDEGTMVTLDGHPFRAVGVDVASAAGAATRIAGGVHAPFRLVAQYDTVLFHRAGEPVVRIGGQHARILSELVAFDGPARWEVVAREVWTDAIDEHALRRKWDVALARLRSRLRAARLPADLVGSDGAGHIELVLRDGDSADDRT